MTTCPGCHKNDVVAGSDTKRCPVPDSKMTAASFLLPPKMKSQPPQEVPAPSLYTTEVECANFTPLWAKGVQRKKCFCNGFILKLESFHIIGGIQMQNVRLILSILDMLYFVQFTCA